MTNRLTKTEQAWLYHAKNYNYNSLTPESKVYFDFLTQKSRIPAQVEKQSVPRTKQLPIPKVGQLTKQAITHDAKMLVFMLGCLIIGLAGRELYQDFQKPSPKPDKVEKPVLRKWH